MDYTTRLALRKPDGDPVTGDYLDVEDLNSNADTIDANISFTVCTSTNRPPGFAGQGIIETDTGRAYVYGGSAWIPLLRGNPGDFLPQTEGRIGLGQTGPSPNWARLLRTWEQGGGATSQVLLQTWDSASGHRALSTRGGTDTEDRWLVDFDGSMQWGPGSGSNDITLKRLDAGSLQLTGNLWVNPSEGAAARVFGLNHNWGVFVDNLTVTGNPGSRFWIDSPDLGDVIIGPRSGNNRLGQFRVRTDASVGNAANLFINATTFQISRSTSSIKYKTNVEDLDLDAELLMQLRPVTFKNKSEVEKKGEDGSGTYIGLIAEEVSALGLHGLVTYREDNGEPDSVQYDRLSVCLLGIVKDLLARVEALEAAKDG